MKKKDYEVPPELEFIPRWMYTGAKVDEEEIARDLISLSYWSMIDQRADAQALAKVKKLKGWDIKKGPDYQEAELHDLYMQYRKEAKEETIRLMGADIYARARAMAQSADASYDKASELGDVMEQVQARIAIDIKEMGLLPYLEYGSIAEYLLSKRSPWDGIGKRPGSHYEIAFMVDYLIPTLEANGFPRKLIIGIAENFHKARYATSYLRDILSDVIARTNEIKTQLAKATDDTEKKRLDKALEKALHLDPRLKEMLETLVTEMSLTAKQGGLGAIEFREKMRRISRNAPEVVKCTGYIYNLKEGGVMMVSIDDTRMLNAVKMSTDKLVDWHLGTPEDLAREVGARLLIDQKDTI